MPVDYAEAYARDLGWHVFPVAPGSKRPATQHGLHDATTNLDTIRSWWQANPQFNVGIATEPSGLAVVDIDDLAALDGLELPDTTLTRTPRGGLHYIYQAPPGGLKSTTSRLAPKVDTRGRGGYILAPPSATADGVYTWEQTVPQALLPDWIVERIESKANPPSPMIDQPTTIADQWGARVLDGELAKVALAQEGQRNNVLFEAACRVFGAVKGGHIDEASAKAALSTAAARAGLHPREIAASLSSAWERTRERHPASTGPPPIVPPALPAPENRRNRTMSISDLDALPPAKWVLPNILPEGFTVMFSEPKVGKTFVALDWALTLASYGQRVVYAAGEGAPGLASRIAAWRQQHPHLDPQEGFSLLALGSFPYLLQHDSVQELFHDLDGLPGPPVLFVLDTWARGMVGGDENKYQDVQRGIAVLDSIRERYGSNILVVHHAAAPAPGATYRPRRPRGHTALDGACDAMWRLDPPAETDAFQYLKLTPLMFKDHGNPPPLEFRLERVGPSIVVNPSTPMRIDAMTPKDRWDQ